MNEIIFAYAVPSSLLGAIGFLTYKLLNCTATLKSLRSALSLLPHLQQDKLEKAIEKLLKENELPKG